MGSATSFLALVDCLMGRMLSSIFGYDNVTGIPIFGRQPVSPPTSPYPDLTILIFVGNQIVKLKYSYRFYPPVF